jgi:hypothetical protein
MTSTKRILLFLLFLVSSIQVNSTFAQSGPSLCTIKWGPQEKVKLPISEFIGRDNDGNYYFASKAFKGYIFYFASYSLVKFDKEMHYRGAVKMALDEKTDQGKLNKTFDGFKMWDNKLYVFSFTHDKKEKKKVLFVQTVNLGTMQLNSDTRVLAKIDYSGHPRFNSGNYEYVSSTDNSKLLIYYNAPFEPGSPEAYGVHVMDNTMKELWHQEYTLPYADEKFSIKDFTVSNEGMVTVVGKAYKEGIKERKKGKPNYDVVALIYDGKDNKGKKVVLAYENFFIADAGVAFDQSSQSLKITGYYSERGAYSIKGVFAETVDLEGKVIKKSNKEFSKDFIMQRMSDKAKARKQKAEDNGKKEMELPEFEFRQILTMDDGSIVNVSERYFVVVVTTYNGKTTTTTYYYHHEDIMLTKIAPDGTILWVQKVPRVCVGVNYNGPMIGYFACTYQNQVYLIFNDNPENLAYKGSGPIKATSLRKAVVTLVKVDGKDASVKRTAMTTTKEQGGVALPGVFNTSVRNGKDITIYCAKGKKQKMGIVSLK